MTALPPLISVSGWSPPPLSEGLDDYPLLISSSGSGTVSSQHLWYCTTTKMNTDKTACERHYSVLIRHEMIRKGGIKLRTNDSHFDSAHCRSSSDSVFRASKLELRIKGVWAELRGAYYLHGKTGNSGWKWNGSRHSVWEASENASGGSRGGARGARPPPLISRPN